MTQGKRHYSSDSAAEVAKVPEEEGKGDEGGGAEQRTGILAVDRQDLGGEDGEEHGLCEDEGDAGREPVQLLEQAPQRGDLAGGALGVLDARHGLGHVLDHSVLNDVVVTTDERHKGDQGGHRHGHGRKKVDKGRRRLLAVGHVVFAAASIRRRCRSRGWKDKHSDDLSHGRQHASDALTGHEGLHVLGAPEARGKRKGAVLNHARGPGGASNHDEDKGEVGGGRGVEKGHGGDGEQREGDDIDGEGHVDAERVRRRVLYVAEDDGRREVGNGRHGENGRLEVGLDPGVACEAHGKVRSGCEEHVPLLMVS